jgi:predicted porin
MKKTLVALAAVAVAGVASAQVTITGAIGFGINDTNEVARSMGWTDGKVTFTGTEDLGGGMSITAAMTIESYGDAAASTGVNAGGQSVVLSTADAGSLTFSSSGAASDDLGVASLPFDANSLLGGTTDDYTLVQYDLPKIVDGLTIGVRMVGTDTVGFASNDKQYRFGYTFGDAVLGFNTKSTSTGTASAASLTYSVSGITLKAVADTSVQTSGTKKTEYSISAPVGALTVAASNMTKGTLKATEVGVTYAMSKRTSLTFGMGTFSGGTTATTDTTSSSRLRLAHTF